MKNSITLLLFALLFVSSCKKDKTNNTISLSGVVLNEQNEPLPNSIVKVGDNSTITNSNGEFVIENLDIKTEKFKVQSDVDGYFTGYRNVSNLDGSNLFTQIVVLAKRNLGTLPVSGGTVGSLGLKVIAPANSFINEDGSDYNGTVKVAARYISAKDTLLLPLTMPGGDFMATDSNGTNGMMQSYGFIATEFTDNAGNKLTPKPTVKVGVTIPSNLGNPITNGAKIWDFSATNGNWNNEKTITKTGSEYFFPATTLYQNLDAFTPEFGTIEGIVKCSDGKPLSNALVFIKSYSTVNNLIPNSYMTYTNQNGKYKATVVKFGSGITFSYYVYASANGGSNTVDVGNIEAGGNKIAKDIIIDCSNNGIVGSGSFKVNSTSYNGECSSVLNVGDGGPLGNIDVSIYSSTGNILYIANMPKQSSGTFNLTDGFDNNFTSNLYAILTLKVGSGYELYPSKVGGTVTKTGANKFSISFTGYTLANSTEYTITGSGTY